MCAPPHHKRDRRSTFLRENLKSRSTWTQTRRGNGNSAHHNHAKPDWADRAQRYDGKFHLPNLNYLRETPKRLKAQHTTPQSSLEHHRSSLLNQNQHAVLSAHRRLRARARYPCRRHSHPGAPQHSHQLAVQPVQHWLPAVLQQRPGGRLRRRVGAPRGPRHRCAGRHRPRRYHLQPHHRRRCLGHILVCIFSPLHIHVAVLILLFTPSSEQPVCCTNDSFSKQVFSPRKFISKYNFRRRNCPRMHPGQP